MTTVSTPDGRQTIFNHKDAIDIARTYISDDYAEYIGDKIVEFDEVEWRNAQEWASDYMVMEQENEYYRDELWEINSQLQQLSVQADEPGFSKKKVVAKIDEIWQHLQKIL